MLVNAFSLLVLAASAAAQSTTTLCVAGQCLDGTSNISIGAVVSGPSNSNKQFVLLPGSYAATTEPQELRTTLADSQSRLTYSPGFAPNASQNAQQTISFPLDITLQPGVLCTNVSLFRGQTHFHAVPTSSETMNSTLGAKAPGGGSIVMPSDVWAAFTTGSGNSRLVLWDTVPDLGQLPSGVGNDELTLVGLQSTTCEPACSGNGICTPAGTCVCPGGGGFTGPSCESCVPGFFGPECQPCPADCETCDEGASGSGLCLVPKVANAPKTCNCINGQCDANGACNCNEGWQDGSGGKCSVCRDGFYLAASGNCEVCELGCTRCQANTGICSQCGTGLAQDANNPRRCIADTAGSTLQCAPNQFPNGAECSICSTACTTCTGPGAAACLQCAGTTYKLDGVCVPTNELGICNGSRRVANNAKGTCDACPAGCAECSIPGFTQTSQFSSAQCTKCLPGTYLSQGKCIEACPKGTFISPQDGSTCQACAGTCGSCAGAAQFCLTCTGSSLAHEGSCVATCPAGTFSSNGACLPCHGDCKACSSAGFDQCTSCSTDRPVLVTSGTAQAGRCMETCSKAQFFDATSSRCQSCDSSCSSCNGAGPNQCLACSNEDSILQGGTCATAKCERDSSVVPGLGVCLSTLVAAPYVDNTPPVSPTAPAPPPSNGGHLAWWQILLMVLGCAFICAAFIFCLRRRMRKKRAAQTAAFARTMESKSVWRRTMGWLGDKLFHTRVRDGDVEALTAKLRAQERERDKQEMEMSETRSKIASLDHGRQTQPFSPLPTLSEAPGYGGGRQWDERSYRSARTERTEDHIERSHTHSPRPSIPEVAVYKHVDGERRPQRTSVSSFYSGTVANQRHSPELLLPDVPPMKPHPMDSRSRFSMSSEATSLFRSVSQRGGNGPDVPQDVRQPTYEDLPIRQHPTGSTSRSGQSDPFSNSRRQPSIDQLRQPLQSQFTGHTEESGRIKNPFWL